MKKLEIFFGICFIVAVIRLNVTPGANYMIVISLFVLSMIYFPLGFPPLNNISLRKLFNKESYENIPNAKIFGTIVLGIGLSCICIGVLFKFLHFPGSEALMVPGLGIVLTGLIVTIVLVFKKRNQFIVSILTRVVLFSAVGIILFLTPNSAIARIEFRNHPEYLKAREAYDRDPKNEELRKKMDLEYYRMVLTNEQFEKYERFENRRPGETITHKKITGILLHP